MQYRPLGTTGLNVSVMALGGAAIGQQYGPVSVSDAADTVHAGIDAGINFIDTSAFYGEGQSESILGEVLTGGWREKVILCTKAGRFTREKFDFSAKGMRECFEGSLRRLKTDHVDVLLAHDIEYATDKNQVFTETAELLHQLKAEGKTRFIGMSALPLAVLKDAIAKCSLDVIISYCHYHLQDQTLLTDLLPMAQQHGVGVLNASPLAMGLLTHQGPPPWHPASDRLKQACRFAAEYCERRGKDLSTLGMQFCFREERIPSTITGTAKQSELKVNLRAMNEPLDKVLLSEVQSILEPVMNQTWPSGVSS
ncbi:aldo/keto reductase [soil metagenome]